MEIETVKNAMSRDLDWDSISDLSVITLGNSPQGPYISQSSINIEKDGVLFYTHVLCGGRSGSPAGLTKTWHISKNGTTVATYERKEQAIQDSSSSSTYTVHSLSYDVSIIPVAEGDTISSDVSASTGAIFITSGECKKLNTFKFVPYKE